MTNLFKTRYLPNVDGTESTTYLTNANTVFIHTYLGDDSTGDGTREKPYRSMTKALTKAGTYILFRGVINEVFSTTKTLIGDDVNQYLIKANYLVTTNTITNLTVDILSFQASGSSNRVIYLSNNVLGSYGNISSFCLYNGVGGGINGANKYNNCTIDTFLGTFDKAGIPFNNSIIRKTINMVNLGSSIWHSVFPSNCIFKYNGTNIIQPNFTNDSRLNIELIRNAYITAGMSSTNVALMFSKDSFGNELCLIIKEQRAGGSHPNVFNKYAETLTGTLTSVITQNQAKTSIQLTVADSSKFPSTGDVFISFTGTYTNNGALITDGNEVFTYTSVTINSGTLITFNGASYTFKVAHSNGATCTRYGDVLNFTLNPDPLNEALWASDTGGYVGCFRPAYACDVETGLSAISNVDENGANSGSGDLFQIVNGELKFNSSSSQLWNRMSDTTTINIPNGSNFKGLNAMSQDGSPFGYYIGKKQTLISPTAIAAGNALTVGKWYKVYNDNGSSVSEAIVYNGVQYLPEYTFLCITGVTTFSTLEPGSGSYVKEILSGVLESIEILPYNDMTTPSTFPKFSAPLMGECKLIFYTASGAARYGKTAGEPVKFADLDLANMITNFGTVKNKISYYDTWAISNADSEFYLLTNAGLSTTLKSYFTQDIPAIKYLRREINGHFDMPYDY